MASKKTGDRKGNFVDPGYEKWRRDREIARILARPEQGTPNSKLPRLTPDAKAAEAEAKKVQALLRPPEEYNKLAFDPVLDQRDKDVNEGLLEMARYSPLGPFLIILEGGAAETWHIGTQIGKIYDGNYKGAWNSELSYRLARFDHLLKTGSGAYSNVAAVTGFSGLVEETLNDLDPVAAKRSRKSTDASIAIVMIVVGGLGKGKTPFPSVSGSNGHALVSQQSLELGRLNRAALARQLRETPGVTTQALRIAQALEDEAVGVNILGERMFETAWKHRKGQGAPPIAFAYGNQVYIRANSANHLSELVHEGTHALDFLAGHPGLFANATQAQRQSRELRAYFYERQFQLATGRKVDFPSLVEMLHHVKDQTK